MTSSAHIPMSSGGQRLPVRMAMMLAQDYDGKVEVVQQPADFTYLRESVLDAVKLQSTGMDAVQIREILEREKFESSIYLTLDTLRYLKKGGRITPQQLHLERCSVSNRADYLEKNWMLLQRQGGSRQIYDESVPLPKTGHPVSGIQRPGRQLAVAHTRNLEAAFGRRQNCRMFLETRDILVADMRQYQLSSLALGFLALPA